MREDLVLEISPKSLDDTTEDFVRINMPVTPSHTPKKVNFSPIPSPSFAKTNESPGPSTTKNRTNFRNLLPKLSFKHRNTTSEIEKAAILALGCSSAEIQNSYRFLTLQKEGAQLPIHRSRSVPVLIKNGIVRQWDSSGGVYHVLPTTPRVSKGTPVTTSNVSPIDDSDGNNDEHIPEEEAVCRICLVELGEGGGTLKMECSCKGELALAHKECAIKWFNIKGNKTCDVCNEDVKNLPVTLLRVPNAQTINRLGRGQQSEIVQYRVWQDVPVLVIVSMLAYFCFLEQLLVSRMKSGAVAISLPFSCILGLVASMTSTTMVRKKYIWVYATIQFGLVVLSAHLFYTLIHIQAVLAVLLATLVGFGVTMCGASVLVEILKLRRIWHSQSNEQVTRQPDQPPITADGTQIDPQSTATENRDPEPRQGS
ncbi:uncharacterized protein LOC110806352 [Carica papaya]|uniref:uncharacterized protein LOC110806352 n=1 Tax=Carica papaya TaxID=3649 RepID=UPI000B8CF46B|nr:uncharacterized protein LOC110806352 [Carica papaya]